MRGRRLATAASLVLGLVGFTGAAGAAPAASASVAGAGWVTLPSDYGDFAGDKVLFQVHAQDGRTVAGAFNVVHLDDAGVYAHLVGEVQCVSVSNGVAVTTGIIRQGWIRDLPGADLRNLAVAITVADEGADDRLAFDFEFFGSTIQPCGALSPWIPVDRGNFVVR